MSGNKKSNWQYLFVSSVFLNLCVDDAYADNFGQLCDENFTHTASKETIEKEIQRGTDIHLLGGKYERNALHMAAFVGNSVAIKTLLNSGADVSAQDTRGGRAITYAAFSGSVDAMQAFLDAGAELGLVSEQEPPLVAAATMSGNIDAVQFLLDKGADPNVLFEGSIGALAFAAGNGRLEIMRLLLSTGANVDLGVGSDGAPIWVAMFQNSVTAIELLIKYGTSLNITDKWGRPLLSEAIGLTTFGRVDPQVVELLLVNGADPNIRDRDGHTMLYLVLRGEGSANRVLKILLENGANPNEPLSNDDSPAFPPLLMVVGSSNMEGAKLLIDAGADVIYTFVEG